MGIPGISDTARALGYYEMLQEVVTNNLANSSTDGFKADRMTATQMPGDTAPVPVESIDLSQGTFQDTGRPYDLSLDGPGFFVTQTSGGDRLTRGGSFTVDPTGRLTDGQGNPLLGQKGPVVVSGNNVVVKGDGTVVVDGKTVDRLQVVNVADPSQLQKEGAGRYVATGAVTAVDPATTKVRQGAVEESNADEIHGMVDLISIQRAYAANMTALHTVDGVLDTVVNQVGRV